MAKMAQFVKIVKRFLSQARESRGNEFSSPELFQYYHKEINNFFKTLFILMLLIFHLWAIKRYLDFHMIFI